MRSLLVLAVLVTASQAYSVFQNPPCSGTTPCLINCVQNSRCPIYNPAKPVLLPGPTCDRFYKCESGRACETLCPGGTHFNAREQACDWPHRACCDPNIECRPDPCGPNDNRCPMFDGLKPTLLPGPNCGVYAKCIAGRACPMQCPAGLHFNAAKQICDWPFQACCDPNVECRPDPCGPSDNRCPMFDGSKPTLLPGPSCGVYAKCIAGRACPMQCPAGLHFNAAKQICDWPFQACCDPSVQCRPDPCPPGAFGCGQNNQNNHFNNNWMWG
ncbi:AGAP005975-PA [Anopheles gambiae str. PEST]|uniref:AGAP005975-PA n=1 Tax=Anopheles gambiae TaxID=7165 RepID=A0NEK5_ANOGA|nr:AGAP005975-PA [Anopheles gambiae str. PEST]